MTPEAPIRRRVREIVPQKIVEVARLGLGRTDTIPLWCGESDVPTPRFICDAAHRAMLDGKTFYAHDRGIGELREAIARYLEDLYGRPVAVERISATTSGMTAIMLALQAIVDPGDNGVLVGPVWPNCASATGIVGGEARAVALETRNGVWGLDLDRVFDACDARTRFIFVNSPGNPTGWVMEHDQMAEMLAFARGRGIWIVADEVYARIVYDRPDPRPAAPSFLELAGDEDPVVVVNSFSKSWAMTGWRMGWVVAPPRLGEALRHLIQVATSGLPHFLQYGAIAALEEGEDFVATMRERCRAGRDVVLPVLEGLPRVSIDRPRAGFYAFFAVEGVTDSLAFARELFLDTRVGLAPGAAFGPEGEGRLRLCFAQSPELLGKAMERLAPRLS